MKCLAAVIVKGDTATRRRRETIMNRFEELLAANFKRQMPIPSLCKAIRVAEGTLGLCCSDFLSMSAGNYMRLRRLSLVHMALQHANPATAKVSEIAKQYGFSELGRFTESYRIIFGGMPSDTIRRSTLKTDNLRFCENA